MLFFPWPGHRIRKDAPVSADHMSGSPVSDFPDHHIFQETVLVLSFSPLAALSDLFFLEAPASRAFLPFSFPLPRQSFLCTLRPLPVGFLFPFLFPHEGRSFSLYDPAKTPWALLFSFRCTPLPDTLPGKARKRFLRQSENSTDRDWLKTLHLRCAEHPYCPAYPVPAGKV